MSQLADSQGRVHRKLRVSITDRCNFRCPYCMPEQPRWLPASQLLRAEQIAALAKVFVEHHGIEAIRVTGGEPLLNKQLPEILQRLNALRAAGLQRLSLTSNAARLAALAQVLIDSGVDDLNISLDSLDSEQFRRLSRGRYGLADVLAGIHAARRVGLPVKINAVIIRDYNEDQVLPLLRWAMAEDLELRFIEFMPLDDEQMWSQDKVVSSAEMLQQISAEFSLEQQADDGSPARRYRLSSGQCFGIIATVTQPFCARCDRLRITATGELYTCLFGREGTLLSGLLDQPAELKQAIENAVMRKPPGYIAHPGYVEREVRMYHLGG